VKNAYPATTDAARLAQEMNQRHDAKHISVVYATCHSIDVVAEAQKKHGLPDFDVIVCDEAHRTTGVKFEGEDESHFIKVHAGDFIRSTKRLYMTVTPRVYGVSAKATAERDNVTLCSMDDESLYGPNLCVLTFSEAVKRGLLVDYKVIVLSIEESHVSRRIQNLLKDENNELRVDDAAKIIGCWKALSKQGLTEGLAGDAQHLVTKPVFEALFSGHTRARWARSSIWAAWQAPDWDLPRYGLKLLANHPAARHSRRHRVNRGDPSALARLLPADRHGCGHPPWPGLRRRVDRGRDPQREAGRRADSLSLGAADCLCVPARARRQRGRRRPRADGVLVRRRTVGARPWRPRAYGVGHARDA